MKKELRRQAAAVTITGPMKKAAALEVWRNRMWKIPREWEGQTVAIIGGGPTLKQEDVDYAVSRGWRRIAVNNAYLLDPAADALVWGDQRWYFWNRFDLVKHTGPYKITWRYVPPIPQYTIHILRQGTQPPAIAEDPGTIVANNSGQGAINVAYHFGVKRVVLLGFDMQMVKDSKGRLQHNWHKLHRRETAQSRYNDVFGPSIRAASEILAKKGVEVVNCTPGSKLKGVPIVDLKSL